MESRIVSKGHFRLEYQDRQEKGRFNDHILMPSQWFATRYPEQAEQWGTPFLEHSLVVLENGFQEEEVTPYAINNDFFGAILGGDRRFGHSVVFYLPEQTFYFKDYDGCFYPVSEQKLTTLLSNLFMKCAQEMPRRVHIHNLFVEFRKPEELRIVIQKAKSILSVGPEFFSAQSINKRQEGPELIVRTAKVFVADSIIAQPGQLIIQNAQERFHQYCHQRNLKAFKRRETKPLLIEAVQERFGNGLRHDLVEEGKKVKGWKGLTFSPQISMLTNN